MLDDTVSPGRIYSLLWDQWKARVLQSAIKLKVFTRLACRPRTGDELRAALNVRAGPRAAVDFFDALVALGLLLSTDEHYHNSAEASECLDENKPALFVGDAINEFLTLPSVDLTRLLRVMTAVSAEPARAMAKKFPWHLVLGEGSSFTGAECKQWLHQAGFREIYLERSTVPGRWLWASN